MAGAASSTLRSAYIKETTAGTTPTTPGFTNAADGFLMTAGAEMSEQRTLKAFGARESVAVRGLPVTGTKQGIFVGRGNEDDVLETLLQGAWSSDVLKDGKTIKTLTVENTIPAGAGGTSTMLRYRGVMATGGSLLLESGQDAKYSWDLLGFGSDAGTTTAITGATYTDATARAPMTCGLDVGTISAAGYTVNCVNRAEIMFNYERRNPQPKLGSLDMCGITPGVFVPVLNLRIYVEANFMAMYNDARGEGAAFAVSMEVGSNAASGSSAWEYTIEFPTCEFGPVNMDFSGDEAFMDVQMLPLYDATTENCVVKITRDV